MEESSLILFTNIQIKTVDTLNVSRNKIIYGAVYKNHFLPLFFPIGDENI